MVVKKKVSKKKTKGTKAKESIKKTKGTKVYKKQVQLESKNKELDKKCSVHNKKSKDCRSARKADGTPECWYNYDTEICTGFVPKR